MFPVAIALLGSGLGLPSISFLAWFGPRGLASILFALVVVEEHEFGASHFIEGVVMLTVSLSVILHGITAYPLSERYGSSPSARLGGPETSKTDDVPVRIRHSAPSNRL